MQIVSVVVPRTNPAPRPAAIVSESKLARLKGKGRDVTAREMLGVLGEARQDHTGRLLSTDPDVAPGATAYLPGEDCSDAPVRSSYLEVGQSRPGTSPDASFAVGGDAVPAPFAPGRAKVLTPLHPATFH